VREVRHRATGGGDADPDLPEDWLDVVEGGIERLRGPNKGKEDEERKTLDEVFDHATLLVLYRFITRGFIQTLDYPVSTGKEGNVFHATAADGSSVAVKIYRTNTATFHNLMPYIEGDPRFGKIGRGHRDLVHVWAQKEYKNLQRLVEAGVRAPIPQAHLANVVIMEFVGTEGTPAPLVKDRPFDDAQKAYDAIVANYRRMYRDAGLVHGDLSEFNILHHHKAGTGCPAGDELVIIDVAQSVLVRHPFARELLERDAKNVARYFTKQGLKLSPDAVKADLRGPDPVEVKDDDEEEEDD